MGESNTAIDSQVLTYLIQAAWDPYDPDLDADHELARERVAIIRIAFYSGGLFLTPTVERQTEAIRDAVKRKKHDDLAMVLIPGLPNLDWSAVEPRVRDLVRRHSDADDCRIVAEAEVAEMERLLTFDRDLRKHLASWTKIKLQTPSERWEEIRIPKGSAPRIHPHPTNPLSQASWWRW